MRNEDGSYQISHREILRIQKQNATETLGLMSD